MKNVKRLLEEFPASSFGDPQKGSRGLTQPRIC
jgi:hypothetical protein